MYQRGKYVSDSKYSLEPLPGAQCPRVILQRVGETGCSLHYRKEKEKSIGGVNFESRGKRKAEDDEALQHACVQPKAKQGAWTIKLISSWVGLRGWFFLTLKVRVIRSSLISHYFTRVISFFFYLLIVNLHGNEDSLQNSTVLLYLGQLINFTGMPPFGLFPWLTLMLLYSCV